MAETLEITDVEKMALKLALLEYYQNFSKKVLQNPNISPLAKEVHEAIITLKDRLS